MKGEQGVGSKMCPSFHVHLPLKPRARTTCLGARVGRPLAGIVLNGLVLASTAQHEGPLCKDVEETRAGAAGLGALEAFAGGVAAIPMCVCGGEGRKERKACGWE